MAGTEMGQGLNTKVAQIVADEFHVDLEQIKITATSTSKVPNTTATAASAGSDMNGKAAQAACVKIRNRLIAFAADHFGVDPGEIIFAEKPGQSRGCGAQVCGSRQFGLA